MAGYSGTPLVRKLGIRPGYRLHVRHPPANYDALVAPLPRGVHRLGRLVPALDMMHIFTRRRVELAGWLPRALSYLRPAGMIWVSWPKKSSGVPSDITEDVIREVALPLGLVDVKVCAVDETWSGLKLVVRREDRP